MTGINGFTGFISDFVRGTTKDFFISIQRNGEIANITGCKFYVTFSKSINPTQDVALEIIIDPPTSPLTGETTGTITDTETFSLSAGIYYYSVRFVNSEGATYVIDMGQVKVYEAVSGRLE